MKRILVFISLVFLVVGFSKINYAATVSPSTTIFTDPETSRERPGGNFTIDIKVAEVTNLTGFLLNMSWDPSILNFSGAEYGGFLGPPEEVDWSTEIFPGEALELLILCIRQDFPLQGFTGNGTLANLTFGVEEWGETLIAIDSYLVGASSDEAPEPEPIDHETVPGKFTNLEGPPVASFTYSPATPKTGQTVFFNATASYDFGGSVVDYIWDFGDGTSLVTENDPVATHAFLTAKTYNVTLKVTDDVGESGVYTTELTVFVPRTIYVNAINVGDPDEDGSLEHPFDMIQEGIDAAGWGDTVQVASGTYFEQVAINVTKLTLVGENERDTVIDGSGTGKVVTILASGVSISDFTIKNGEAGIYQYNFTGVTIRDNTILDNGVGIDLRSSNNSVIVSNNVTSNTDRGISLNCSYDNTVIGNIISNKGDGIVLFKSSSNTFSGNTVERNNVGVSIDNESELNRFHHNNFINNTNQAVDHASNMWDDGAEGNYWSDYTGQDPDGDGIGDIPYSIDFDSQDNYPLTPDWKDTENPTANAGEDRTVNEDTLVTFDGSASKDNVGIVSYVWNFTDVTAQMLKGVEPIYVFETPGIYLVTLTVNDVAGNWATDNVTITVLDITNPVANAGENQTVTVGTTVTFDASGSSDNVGIVSYEWDFGDGTPLVTENDSVTTHTYTELGNFTVKLTVKDEAGNFDTAYVVVQVRKATSEPIIPLWVIGVATVVIGGVLAGTALVLRRRRSTQRRQNNRDLHATYSFRGRRTTREGS